MGRVLLWLAVPLIVLASQIAAAQGKTIVILAPHPDDEALCCAGVIYSALQQGDTVKVVVVTNGDYYSPGVPLGYAREAESVAAMGVLGLTEQDVIFFGYGDQTLQGLYQSTSPTTVITSAAGQTETYANRGLGGVSYHQYVYGAPGEYNRQTILDDMETMLQNLHPDDVYTTGLWDDHPDHRGTFNFVVEALLDLKRQGVALTTRVHETLVHPPCSSCGVPSIGSYEWPGGGPGILPSFVPTQPFSEPYYLSSMTPYAWNQIESLPVPAPMQNPNQSSNLKAQVISQYVSQGGDTPTNYLFSFVKMNEFFWIRYFSTNVAGLASVSASSQDSGDGSVAASAVDGFIEGYPGYAPWEWVTNGQLNGAWITLTWPNPVTISQVVLYNRQDGVDDVISGTLSFSDGSSVPVGQLPINGNGTLVSFAPKTVSSMTFTVNNAVGEAIGLTEIEVFGELAGSTVDHPQIFQGPTPSAPLQDDQYGQLLTASITDAGSTTLNVTAFDVDAQPLNYTWTSSSGTMTGNGATATFNPPIVASPTLVATTVAISDGKGGTTQNSTYVTVTPSNSSGISVSSVSISPASVASGSSAVGTVALSSVAPEGAVVSLSNTNSAIATVPTSVVLSAGEETATFPINTVYVASTTSLTISATLGGVTQTAPLTVLQPPVIVSSVTVAPPTVGGGNSTTGTVTLSGPALAGGAVVTLASSSPAVATVPASVTVPAGATSASFPITTQPLTSPVSVTLSASYVGQTSTVSVRVAPYVAPNLATIAAVSVSSENDQYQQQGIKAIDGVVDGAPAPGDYTKEWATNGQLAGAWITLTWTLPVTTSQVVLYDRPNLTDNVTSATLSFSDGSTVPVGTLPNDGSPLAVSFPSKTVTWMTFTVNTAVGQNIGLAEIAVIGSVAQASQISTLTLSSNSVIGGNGVTGTVALNGAAPAGGAVVTLTSSNTSAATVPASVTVPSGSLSAIFPVSTGGVGVSTPVTISGSYNGTQQATLTVNPVAISSLSLSPTMVAGSTASSTGTITLNGPAPTGGAVVTLTSSNPSIATVGASTTIPAGTASGTFTVATSAVTTTTSVAISATFNGQQSATLLVTPPVTGGGMVEFASDSFNRPNGSLGINWTTILDADSSPVLVSQQAQSSWGRAKSLYYGGINWPADQYAQAQIIESNGGSSGPAVRMTSNGSYYAGTIGSLGQGNANVYILLDNAGSQSLLASSSTATVLAGDYIQLSVQGTTITLSNVTESTTLLTATDSTITAGYPGIYVADGGALANWSAGLSTAPLSLTTLASDNFNRPNAPNLGTNWAVGPGYYSIQIVNDQIESDGQGQPPGQGHGKEYYTAASFPSDQWSQAQVIASNNDVNGAIVRYQGTVDTHYVGFVSRIGSPGSCSVSIDRDINGSPVVLATDSTYCSVSAGDYMRLQVQGSLLSYIDATTGALLLTAVDNQITGGSPGWSLNPNGGTPTAANWSGGSFGQ
jgi:LmbE family N-acetylglucosaminyl deacetylase